MWHLQQRMLSAKLANGIADDMVTTTLLATTAEVWIAPAMNVHMYENTAVIRNIATAFKRRISIYRAF